MRRFALVFVIAVAFLLRIIWLASYPAGFNADEASFGYDAYSILKTGRDQWGNLMPLVLKSFGDYKSPLYSYLTIPSIKILGLTKFAVRLPNVIIGTLAVISLYLLSNELYKKKFGILNLPFGILPAFLLAINPWHIMLSRGAFEANLITFFLPMGIFFFLKGLKDYKFLIFSSLFFGLNLFTYHSAKLLTPLTVLGLIVVFWKKIVGIKFQKTLPALIVFLIFFSALLYSFKIGGGGRISERSIIQGALEQGAEEKIKLINAGQNPVLAKILHNKYQVVVQRFVSNYLQYFSTKFFITNGAGEGYYGMIPGIGTVYIFDLVLFAGILILLFKKEMRWMITLLFLWLLAAPLPAALSTGVGYSGTRAEGMAPVIQIIESFGLLGWISVLKKLDKKAVMLGGLALLTVAVFEIWTFGVKYFHSPPNSVTRSMLFGSLEVSEWLKTERGQKDIIISRSISEPQIFIAFAGKWDPKDFQKQTSGWNFDNSRLLWVDQLPEWKLGPYTFKSIDWKTDGKKKNTLIVGRPDEFPVNINTVKFILYPDGSPAIMVVDFNQKVYAATF